MTYFMNFKVEQIQEVQFPWWSHEVCFRISHERHLSYPKQLLSSIEVSIFYFQALAMNNASFLLLSLRQPCFFLYKWLF